MVKKGEFMKFYNTLSKLKEKFYTLEEKKVKIYSCGPTVYNYIHIGNARPICVFDVLRRYLKYKNYKVIFVQNFTDIDDKIIKKAQEENKNYKKLTEFYIQEYKKDAENLNILKADFSPKATENIQEIIDFISELIKKDYAYTTSFGDVFFRAHKFKEYGKLSGQSLKDLESGARIEVNKFKENPADFSLWKNAKLNEPFWKSPWGRGRPGWHIECSVMAKKILGESFDIHCGGQDLIFPHHENEIAQSECCNDKKLANFWLHNGYINIDNKKMSKSLNNFYTVREIAEKHGYEAIRYLMISAHYRSPINFTEEIINQCKSALERLYSCKKNLDFLIKKNNNIKENLEIKDKILKNRENFINFMDDYLNTAGALSCIFDLVKNINNNLEACSKENLLFIKKIFTELTDILGILYKKEDNENLDEEIEGLIKKREEYRKNKDFEAADLIREKLYKLGVILEDTKNGIKWSFK